MGHGGKMEIPDVKIPRKVLNTHDLTAKRNEWILTPPAPVVKYLKHILKEERDLPIGQGLNSALADFFYCSLAAHFHMF